MATRKGGLSRTLVIPILLPLVFIILFSKSCLANSNPLNYTKYKHVSSSRLANIQRHLNKINKPPVYTIESPDGDIIDCIRETEQPAFDHPLLKHHKIQEAPQEMPKAMKIGITNKTKRGALGQTWHQKGQWCPKGTVPIRRSTVDDVLRAKSLHHFGKKRVNSSPRSARPADENGPTIFAGVDHQHVFAETTTSQAMYGAKASINLWDPMVEASGEFSLSQLWVLSGSLDGGSLNSIEAGWQVFPQMYGDNSPRLFTYWTRDAYRSTGCYNLLCSGFVQTNTELVSGAALSPVSSIDGKLVEITITIWKDPKEGNWWLAFDDTIVGYWPNSIFTELADHATVVEWGGEIINLGVNNIHTSTQMGSGHFAEDGYGKASYFRNLEIVELGNNLVPAYDVTTIAENPNCYNIQMSSSNEWGTYFYYGGPGRNPKCP